MQVLTANYNFVKSACFALRLIENGYWNMMRTKEYVQIQVIWVHTVEFTNTHKWFYSKNFCKSHSIQISRVVPNV